MHFRKHSKSSLKSSHNALQHTSFESVSKQTPRNLPVLLTTAPKHIQNDQTWKLIIGSTRTKFVDPVDQADKAQKKKRLEAEWGNLKEEVELLRGENTHLRQCEENRKADMQSLEAVYKRQKDADALHYQNLVARTDRTTAHCTQTINRLQRDFYVWRRKFDEACVRNPEAETLGIRL